MPGLTVCRFISDAIWFRPSAFTIYLQTVSEDRGYCRENDGSRTKVILGLDTPNKIASFGFVFSEAMEEECWSPKFSKHV